MLCIKCKQEIPDISIYCMFCGKKQVSTSAAPVKKARNPNGTGTVFKRGRTWSARVRVYRHGEFVMERTKGGFATRADAINYLPQLRTQENGGTKSYTVSQVFDLVQQSRKWQEISPDKRSHYLTAYKRLEPLYERDVSSLHYSELQNLLDGIEGAFYPKRDAKTILQKIIDMAVLEKVCPPDSSNMIRCLELPSKPPTAKDARTPEEMHAIWQDWRATQDPITGYALIMAYTGMRTGELFAQDVSKVDPAGQIIVGGIKTDAGKNREIPIADCIVPVVQAVLPKARYGLVAYDENDYYTNWKLMCQRTGIRPLGSYCQRHTCYTRLHELVPAVSDVVINSIMGHSNAKNAALADSYGHISLSAKLDAVNRLQTS